MSSGQHAKPVAAGGPWEDTPDNLGRAFTGALLGVVPEPSRETGGGPLENYVDESVRAMIDAGLRTGDVPKLPDVAVRLVTELDRGMHAADLAALVKRDPALACEVLHLANSPAYGASGSAITTIEQAFVYLGEKTMRSLVLASSVRPLVQIKPIYFRLFGSRLWEHAHDCATACRILAQAKQVDSEVAYFVGLIHDIGKLIVFRVVVEAIGRFEEKPKPYAVSRMVDRYADTLTGLVVDEWHLPEVIGKPLQEQNRVRPGDLSPMGAVLYVGNALAEVRMLLTERVADWSRLEGELRRRGIKPGMFTKVFPDIGLPESAAG